MDDCEFNNHPTILIKKVVIQLPKPTGSIFPSSFKDFCHSLREQEILALSKADLLQNLTYLPSHEPESKAKTEQPKLRTIQNKRPVTSKECAVQIELPKTVLPKLNRHQSKRRVENKECEVQIDLTKLTDRKFPSSFREFCDSWKQQKLALLKTNTAAAQIEPCASEKDESTSEINLEITNIVGNHHERKKNLKGTKYYLSNKEIQIIFDKPDPFEEFKNTVLESESNGQESKLHFLNRVNTLEEFKQALHQHEADTKSRFIYYNGTKSFSKLEKFQPSNKSRLHWDGGTPYFQVGRRLYACCNGKDYNVYNKKKAAKRTEEKAKSENRPVLYREASMKTMKLGCPVFVNVIRIYWWPEIRVNSRDKRTKSKLTGVIKRMMQMGMDLRGEDTFVFEFPKLEDHKFHLPGEVYRPPKAQRKRYPKKKKKKSDYTAEKKLARKRKHSESEIQESVVHVEENSNFVENCLSTDQFENSSIDDIVMCDPEVLESGNNVLDNSNEEILVKESLISECNSYLTNIQSLLGGMDVSSLTGVLNGLKQINECSISLLQSDESEFHSVSNVINSETCEDRPDSEAAVREHSYYLLSENVQCETIQNSEDNSVLLVVDDAVAQEYEVVLV